MESINLFSVDMTNKELNYKELNLRNDSSSINISTSNNKLLVNNSEISSGSGSGNVPGKYALVEHDFVTFSNDVRNGARYNYTFTEPTIVIFNNIKLNQNVSMPLGFVLVIDQNKRYKISYCVKSDNESFSDKELNITMAVDNDDDRNTLTIGTSLSSSYDIVEQDNISITFLIDILDTDNNIINPQIKTY